MTSRRVLRAALAASLALACAQGGSDSAPVAPRPTLGPDDCASVGSERISVQTVSRIGRAQSVSAPRARELAVRDALWAEEAKRRFGTQTVLRSAALARAVLQDVKREAAAAGAPSADEVRRLTGERWTEVDRPPSVRTTHAVVRVASEADDARAHAVAARLAAALEGERDPERFIEAARRQPADGLELRAERLPPITADGRAAAGPATTFDADFARAAHALTEVGQHSAVVRTRFGYHVILLEERLPERRLSFDERRALFEPEIQVRRARKLEQALLERLKRERPPELSRAASELMAQVRVSE